MNDPHRYPVFGDLLHVDLSDRSCTRGPVPESSVARLLGGRGFNVGYLYDHLPTGIDPLGPDNRLVFSCGLLPVPGRPRHRVFTSTPCPRLPG
jgi:aldehyde:ferredoxin oxidoreductase